MLLIAVSMRQIQFSELMDVYHESNVLNGLEKYSDYPPDRQLLEVEQDFYQYLNSVFYGQKDSFCAIWEADGKYQSALRIEPYQDGSLLCALETRASARCRGYANALIVSLQKYLAEQGSGVLYSHVDKNNLPSLLLHQKCGFQITKDYAVYADGSVFPGSFTLQYEFKKSET
jgi:ribosomal protein S18 acetylase RimI-like enzyme